MAGYRNGAELWRWLPATVSFRGAFVSSENGLHSVGTLQGVACFSPHRVFRWRFGRVEVDQPIPAPRTSYRTAPCACAAEIVGTPPRSRRGSPHADRWILGIILFPPNPIGSGRAGVDGRSMRHSNAYGAAAACRNWRREREIFAALTAGQSTASSL